METIRIDLNYPIADILQSSSKFPDASVTIAIKIHSDKIYVYEFPKVYAFILMKTARRQLQSDPNTASIDVVANVSKDFVASFFDSLKNDYIEIQKRDLSSVITLASKLEMDYITEKLNQTILELIVQCFDQSGVKYTTEKMCKLIAQNINKIPANLIKELSLKVQINIIKNKPSHISEDFFANFIVDNGLDKELLHYIDFKKLTQFAMEKVIKYIGEDTSFVSDLISRIKSGKKEVNILCIYPIEAVGKIKIINMNFFNNLNAKNDKCNITATTMSDTEFRKAIDVHEDFLLIYHIIVVGHCNAAYDYFKANKNGFDAKARECLEKFYQNGGRFIFLHDVFFPNPQESVFITFKEQLGNINEIQYQYLNEVSFREDNNQMMKTPFRIPKSFGICSAHQSFNYDKMTPFISYSKNMNQHYCQATSDQRFIVCEAGHSGEINENEQKLLFNIIYHIASN